MSIIFTGLMGKGKDELLAIRAELIQELEINPGNKSAQEELEVIEKELAELV